MMKDINYGEIKVTPEGYYDHRSILLYNKNSEMMWNPRDYDKVFPLNQKLAKKYEYLIVVPGDVIAGYKSGRERVLSEKQIAREHIPSFGDLYYRGRY